MSTFDRTFFIPKFLVILTMKKALLLLCLTVVILSFGQILKGTVTNDASQTISGVNIYLDGTKIATTSSQDGSFQLPVSEQTKGNLVFQKDDYDTFSVKASDYFNKNLKVVLNKVTDIQEVIIIPYTDEAYRNYINYFLDKFIGYGRDEVKIKNQKSLKFSYDKKNKFLKVKAPQTLIIENKNLGYTIQYNLINFEADFNNKSSSYLGTSFFKEMKPKNEYIQNRINAYKGSLMHFFRSIYQNELEKEGFIVNQARRIKNPQYPSEEEIEELSNYFRLIKSQKIVNISMPSDLEEIAKRRNQNSEFLLAILKTKLKESDFTKREKEKVFLKFDDLLQVNYKKYYYELKKGKILQSEGYSSQSSIIHPEMQEFEIFQEGFTSDPDQLILEESFSQQNISKMLPLDYQLGD